MTWRHTALRQNFLFFIAARRRRGSEMLAKQCVGMGVNLEEVDVYGQTPLFWAAARGNMVVVNFLLQLGFEVVYGQTPLFWAAARGNMVVVNFLLQLGFEVNYRDYARKTALFFAIENGHLDVADFLIERAASIQVRSKEQKTPQTMLKALNHKAPQKKRKWVSPTPSCVCTGAATRSRFAQWEWAQEESEPVIIERSEDNVLLESQQHMTQ
eukprot:s6406_g6.t1